MNAFLVLTFLAQLQPQPFKDWEVQRREPNPKTGKLDPKTGKVDPETFKMEIVSIIRGDEALLLNATRGKEVADIKGLRLRYFTDPKKPGEKSQEIQLRSDT